MHNLALAIQWREDVARGEMIEAPGYTEDCLTLGYTPWCELEAICYAINVYYAITGSNSRVRHKGWVIKPWLSGT